MSITRFQGQHTLVRRATGQAARITSAPLFAPAVSMNVHRGLWRAVHRLKHPTCPVRNVYHRLPEPAYACPPPAGQSPQFPHACCPPLLCPRVRRRVPASTTVSTPQPCAPALCMDLRRKDFSRDQNVVFHSPPRPTDLKSSIFNPQ